MKTIILISILSFLIFAGCKKNDMDENSGNMNNSDEWLIPKGEVRDGGPGKDGIPALQNPKFINANEATYLSDNDLVLGFADGDEVRAYPHSILDWHEIINDDTKNNSLAVIYCPLTGTGIGWDREMNGTKTTFGVSGLLYNSNIIPYDRATGSNWSQLLLKSVNGQLSGNAPKTYNLLETTWKTWKQMYPASKVVSENTGHNRNYGNYPYGSYKTTSNLLFPVSNSDTRVGAKERVLTVIVSGKAKAYRMKTFLNTLSLVNDEFENKKLVVVASSDFNLMVAFNRVLADGTTLNFQPVQNALPVVLRDSEGTSWDAFGRGISGPRTGQKLEQVAQMMGYWFSFAAFYPEISIY